MKKEELFDIIGEIDDRYLLRSEKKVRSKKIKKVYSTVLAVAACMTLVVTATWFGKMSPPQTGEENSQTDIGSLGNGDDFIPSGITGGAGEDVSGSSQNKKEETQERLGMEPDTPVDFYPGALMPMTLKEDNSHISANRQINYDFSKMNKASRGFVTITDQYVLKNQSEKDQEVTISYPYIGSMEDLVQHYPQLTINGEKTTGTISSKAYMGKDSQGNLQLFSPAISTDEYSSMMKELQKVGTIDEKRLDEKVTVYEFTDGDKGKVSSDGAAYVARMKVKDVNKVYTVNMGGYYYDKEYLYVGFFIEDAKKSKIAPKLIFIGDEPVEYEELGYTRMDFFKEYETKEVTAKRKEYESTIGTELKTLIELQASESIPKNCTNREELKALYEVRCKQVMSDILRWNLDGKETKEDDVAAYYSNNLSDVTYLIMNSYGTYEFTKTITIPAGETLQVQWKYEKQGNHNTSEPKDKFLDQYGYDNCLNLGTNLTFTKQQASVTEADNIRIVDQNYGFDLDNHVHSVDLELDAERYYMVVKVLK